MNLLQEYSSDSDNENEIVEENSIRTTDESSGKVLACLPDVPDALLNKYHHSMKKRSVHGQQDKDKDKDMARGKEDDKMITSFIYIDLKLSDEQRAIIRERILLKEHQYTTTAWKNLMYDEYLKLPLNLHISLSWNFRMRLDLLDDMIEHIGTELSKSRTTTTTTGLRVQLDLNKATILQSQSVQHKQFLSIPVLITEEIRQLMSLVNDSIESFCSAPTPGLGLGPGASAYFQRYDPEYLHCSVAERVSNELHTNASSSSSLHRAKKKLSLVTFDRIDHICITRGTRVIQIPLL